MKRAILFLLICIVSAPISGMEYLKSIFHYNQPVYIVPTPCKPYVDVIELYDAINFKQVCDSLIASAKNKEIAGIILVIDNNGGNAGSFSAVHDLVKRITKIKPVVAVIGGAACSGGYLIASASDYIFAQNFSDIGNIGVILELAKYKKSKTTGAVEAKFDMEVIDGGEFKAIYNPYKKLTEDQKLHIQERIQKLYQQFIGTVAENRNLNAADYKIWAEGKIFLGTEALELGLIDAIGTIFEAEDKILQMIKDKNPDCVFADEIVTNLLPALQ